MKNFRNEALNGNKIIESLSANIAENSYTEITRSSGLASTVIIWTSAAKTQKIREHTITRTGSLATTVETKQYNAAGSLVRTYTETITRSGGLIADATGVET